MSRGRTIELVGPAGSGKTTLVRALAAIEADVRPGVAYGGLGHLRLGARHGVRLLPAWLRSRDRFLDEKELRSMNYVVGWAEALERAPYPGLTVFDHGPIVRLARLRSFGPRLTESAAFARWDAAAVSRWARLLDAVVWLDAPDAVLAGRIDGRDERHRMKGGAAAETARFLARYRASYEALLRELRAAGGPEPIRVDTSREAPEVIAQRVVRQLCPGIVAHA
jgi:energy-coupling factor transporter ATP-binding protein EcfA2